MVIRKNDHSTFGRIVELWLCYVELHYLISNARTTIKLKFCYNLLLRQVVTKVVVLIVILAFLLFIGTSTKREEGAVKKKEDLKECIKDTTVQNNIAETKR